MAGPGPGSVLCGKELLRPWRLLLPSQEMMLSHVPTPTPPSHCQFPGGGRQPRRWQEGSRIEAAVSRKEAGSFPAGIDSDSPGPKSEPGLQGGIAVGSLGQALVLLGSVAVRVPHARAAVTEVSS